MKARKLHARYYLKYIQGNPNDWSWFDSVWCQIQHAWKFAVKDGDEALLLEYLRAFEPLLDQRVCGMKRSSGSKKAWKSFDLLVWEMLKVRY